MELEAAPTPSSTPSTTSGTSDERLKLISVVGGETAYFDWKPDRKNCDTVTVLFDVIQNCCHRFNNLNIAFANSNKSLDRVNKEDFEDVREVLDIFNNGAATMSKLWKGATNPEALSWSQDRADVPLLTYICNTVFNSAVSSVKLLNNHYQPFSSEVYGETKYEQMQKVIEQLKFKDHDIFVDLGSGVGHLVLYVAGGTKVKKAVGIEKAAVPAGYANRMKVEYKKWMGWFKKRYRPYELIQGDFLSPEFKHLITQEATIVFINNYAFNPDLEMRIKNELLAEMKDGTRIVSTKPYAQGNKIITDRLLGDVESILDVTQLETVQCPTSWTDKHVPYYLHTVNRSKLEEYFNEMKEKTNKSTSQSATASRRTSMSSKSNSSSREGSLKLAESKSSLADFDEEEEGAMGPTTRHQWKEYTNGRKRKSPATGSPRWDADHEYVPPGSKKGRKPAVSSPMARVQKEKVPSKRTPKATTPARMQRATISEEARAGIEELHHRIASPPKLPAIGDGLVRVNLGFHDKSSAPMQTEKTSPMVLPPGAVVLDPADPLDLLFIQQISTLRAARNRLLEEDFKMELITELARETAKKAEYTEKVKEKTQLMQMALQQGVSHLRDRLRELDMPEVNTTGELLTCSKAIVSQHKELTQSVSHIEAEVAGLEGKLRSNAPFGEALIEKLSQFDDTSECDRDQKYNTIIQQCAAESGYPAPIMQRLESDNEGGDGVLSPGGPKRKPRPRNNGSRKGKTEESNEEVDRKVQEIVMAAKIAENMARENKDRRARGSVPPEKQARKNPPGSGDPLAVPLPRSNNFQSLTTSSGSTPTSTSRAEATAGSAVPIPPTPVTFGTNTA